MRISAISIPLFFCFAFPESLAAQPVMPVMRTVDPVSAKTGDVVVVQGENLGAERVSAVYLTDGTVDVKVPILEQTATAIKFRIPREAKPGRLALMVLTKDKEPRLIEEPVKITIEGETGELRAAPSARQG